MLQILQIVFEASVSDNRPPAVNWDHELYNHIDAIFFFFLQRTREKCVWKVDFSVEASTFPPNTLLKEEEKMTGFLHSALSTAAPSVRRRGQPTHSCAYCYPSPKTCVTMHVWSSACNLNFKFSSNGRMPQQISAVEPPWLERRGWWRSSDTQIRKRSRTLTSS